MHGFALRERLMAIRNIQIFLVQRLEHIVMLRLCMDALSIAYFVKMRLINTFLKTTLKELMIM